MLVFQKLQQLFLRCLRKGLAVIKIPGLRIKAALAVMGAATDKEGHSQAGAIGNI